MALECKKIFDLIFRWTFCLTWWGVAPSLLDLLIVCFKSSIWVNPRKRMGSGKSEVFRTTDLTVGGCPAFIVWPFKVFFSDNFVSASGYTISLWIMLRKTQVLDWRRLQISWSQSGNSNFVLCSDLSFRYWDLYFLWHFVRFKRFDMKLSEMMENGFWRHYEISSVSFVKHSNPARLIPRYPWIWRTFDHISLIGRASFESHAIWKIEGRSLDKEDLFSCIFINQLTENQ